MGCADVVYMTRPTTGLDVNMTHTNILNIGEQEGERQKGERQKGEKTCEVSIKCTPPVLNPHT